MYKSPDAPKNGVYEITVTALFPDSSGYHETAILTAGGATTDQSMAPIEVVEIRSTSLKIQFDEPSSDWLGLDLVLTSSDSTEIPLAIAKSDLSQSGGQITGTISSLVPGETYAITAALLLSEDTATSYSSYTNRDEISTKTLSNLVVESTQRGIDWISISWTFSGSFSVSTFDLTMTSNVTETFSTNQTEYRIEGLTPATDYTITVNAETTVS